MAEPPEGAVAGQTQAEEEIEGAKGTGPTFAETEEGSEAGGRHTVAFRLVKANCSHQNKTILNFLEHQSACRSTSVD